MKRRKGKITKKEIKYIFQFILLGLGLALVSDPIDKFFTDFFGNEILRVFAGMILLGIVVYLFKIQA